jgi:ubiquinone/menaquinone biosynthesis C-methylase UbiE
VARRIVGLDVSRDMLAEAAPHARIHYVAADAGAIPLVSGSVPLVTVGLAYHWLDHTRFLREASRVLRANGWLVVYNTRFTGRLADVPSFADWWAEQYLVRYPPLPQRSHAITADEASAYGFDLVDHTTFDVPVPLSKAELIAYLSTQSNLLAVAAQRSLPHELEWIETSVREYIDETGGTFRFGGELWVFRRPSL